MLTSMSRNTNRFWVAGRTPPALGFLTPGACSVVRRIRDTIRFRCTFASQPAAVDRCPHRSFVGSQPPFYRVASVAHGATRSRRMKTLEPGFRRRSSQAGRRSQRTTNLPGLNKPANCPGAGVPHDRRGSPAPAIPPGHAPGWPLAAQPIGTPAPTKIPRACRGFMALVPCFSTDSGCWNKHSWGANGPMDTLRTCACSCWHHLCRAGFNIRR